MIEAWVDVTRDYDKAEGARMVQIRTDSGAKAAHYPMRYRMAPSFGAGEDWIEDCPIWRRYPEALRLPADRLSRDEAIRRDIEAARRAGCS